MEKTLAKLKRGEHVTIVAFGDSNTAETFHTRGHMTWPSLLAEAIFEEYGTGVCTVINSAVCGTGFADSMARLDRDVVRYRPDLTIVCFGVGAANHGLEKIEPFKQSIRNMILAIREKCGSEILLRTPNPFVGVGWIPLPEGCSVGEPMNHKPYREYARAQLEVGTELGCAVVDHYTLWSEAKFPFKHPVANPQGLWPRMSDAGHPGELGHLAYFRDMAPLFGVAKYFPWEHIETE